MPTDPVEGREKTFVPVHVCIHCGHVSGRHDADGVPNPSGIFRCSVCGQEGPLNVEIREQER